MKAFRRNEKGFTLIEIMIVVLIIGILLAIAVPNFIRARETSRTKSCIANLKQIDAAKEQWAMENRKNTGAAVVQADVDPYVKTWPLCPSGGAGYLINVIGTDPTCQSGVGTHVL